MIGTAAPCSSVGSSAALCATTREATAALPSYAASAASAAWPVMIEKNRVFKKSKKLKF
jgi:hypothetical protein